MTNETGYEIAFLFTPPEDTDIWGVDVLGSETILEPAQTITFYLDEFDILNVTAVDLDDDTYSFQITAIDDELDADILFEYID